MRTISADIAASLAAEATTLCHCWRLLRRDGSVLGFTDHDIDLAFSGTIYRAASGLERAQGESALGLAVSGGDVSGALSSDALSEADLSSGLFDSASVEIWLVDWSDPARRLLMDVATLGEIRRSDNAFTAELRSLAHRFDEERGSRFQRDCMADLGDTRCKVSLDPAWRSIGTIIAVEQSGALLVQLDSVFAAGTFTDGRLTLTSGTAAGVTFTIKLHEEHATGVRLVPWTPANAPLASGDHFFVLAGCDKSARTCAEKFGNIANFRGFPHIPGNDVVLSYPNSGDPRMDGGSLFS